MKPESRELEKEDSEKEKALTTNVEVNGEENEHNLDDNDYDHLNFDAEQLNALEAENDDVNEILHGRFFK